MKKGNLSTGMNAIANMAIKPSASLRPAAPTNAHVRNLSAVFAAGPSGPALRSGC